MLTAEHDDHGLVWIIEDFGRRSEVRYERPPAGFDLDAACRALEDALLTLIPQAMARLVLDGLAACVALSDYRSNASSTEVCAATEDERTALAAIDVQAAWSAADFESGSDIDADDFVVYPVDLELVDLERNLADCLPPDRLARLRERGLL